jgi:metallo-beta-lactamase class B
MNKPRIARERLWATVLAVWLGSSSALAAGPDAITLTHLRGGVYVAEDRAYYKENSVVYIGHRHVTVVGATWTPETARQLADRISRITDKPIREVINPNYHPDRAGGNAYWRAIGAAIVATQQTADAMQSGWQEVVDFTRQSIPDYPELALVMPDRVMPGTFALQDGRVQALYLSAAHTGDGIVVYFPEEKVLYGNCLLKQELGNLKYADLAEYPRTLQKLKALHLEFEVIIAGHQDALHGPRLIDHYLNLLQRR